MTYVAPITGNDGQASGSADNTNPLLETSLTGVSRLLVYAEDPNWDGLSPDRIEDETGVRPGTNLANDFNFVAANSTPAAFTNLGFDNHEYVLENTMAAKEQWEDVTTRILIRGEYQPVGIAAGASYYFYAGSAFTHAQIVGMVNTPLTNPWPTTPSGFKTVVDAAIAAGWDFTPASVEPTASAKEGALSFYKDQVSYYPVLIRHFDDDYSVGDLNFGRYGVVRNNIYKITINTISGPGEPTIPDPEDPDDKKKAYISANVEVLPWVVREQGVGL